MADMVAKRGTQTVPIQELTKRRRETMQEEPGQNARGAGTTRRRRAAEY